MATESNAKAYFIMIIGLVAHAFTAPWVKMSNFQPITSVILRCGLAAIFLLPFALHEIKKIGKLNKKGILLSIYAGLFLGVDFICFNYSIYYVGSGVAMILLNIQVIILPALARIFDGEEIPKSYYFIAPAMILFVSMAGGVFNSVPAAATGPTEIYGYNLNILGTIAGALSGTCYGFYLYFSRKASRINNGQYLQPMTISTTFQLVAPIVAILVFSNISFDLTHGVLVGGHLPMNPETTFGDPITMTNWFWVVVLAGVGQAMVWTFIQYGAMKLNPNLVAGMLLLSPIATVVLIAPTLFGEVPSSLQTIGIVATLTLVAYNNGVIQAIFGKKNKKA